MDQPPHTQDATESPRALCFRILYTVDANTFASLAVLNRKWRRLSDIPELYAHHLTRSPLFAACRGTIGSRDLACLKKKFARELRRNTFDRFLRPRTTLINLISRSPGSATALPAGEALKFSFSANGRVLLCLSSSRIFVLDLASEQMQVLYELKTQRRPLDATILDDAHVMAVVSHRHQVNIYHLSGTEAKHVQVITVNDVPRTLAFAPSGSVLAIACDGSIEVYAIGENAMATQRRAVRCPKVESLAFSSDGTLLLGSSLSNPEEGFVTITAPFPPDAPLNVDDLETQIWTTQVLFPDIVTGYSHVSLWPDHMGQQDNWIMGYDAEVKAFRIVKANDTKAGTVCFVGPALSDDSREPTPTSCPAMDCHGELVALTFQNRGLWLYGLPDDVKWTPATDSTSDINISNANSAESSEESPNASRLRSAIPHPCLLIGGRKVMDIPGLRGARWVTGASSSCRRRLVAVAPGGVTVESLGEAPIPADGGRIAIIDFEPSTTDGEKRELTLELGEAVPLVLRERSTDLEQEVELERRRTRVQRGAIGMQRSRPPTDRNPVFRQSYPSGSQKSAFCMHRSSRSQNNSPVDEETAEDGDLLMDDPYSNTAPRSRDTLQRAATASRSSRRPRYQTEEAAPPVPHIPHESDADNWEPPPPPYTREPEEPLPAHLRELLSSLAPPPRASTDPTLGPMHRVASNPTDGHQRSGLMGSLNSLTRRLSTRRGSSESRFRRNQSRSHQGQSPTQGNFVPSPRRPGWQAPPTLVVDPPPPQPQLSTPDQSPTSRSPNLLLRLPRSVPLFGRHRALHSTPERPSTGDAGQSSDISQMNSIGSMRAYSHSSPDLRNRPDASQRMSTIYSDASRVADHRDERVSFHSRANSAGGLPPAGRLTQESLDALSQAHGGYTGRFMRPPPSQHQPDRSAGEPQWTAEDRLRDEEWRARIEQWNEQTINERRKEKLRGRCTVM